MDKQKSCHSCTTGVGHEATILAEFFDARKGGFWLQLDLWGIFVRFPSIVRPADR